jgi:hypothetical protein
VDVEEGEKMKIKPQKEGEWQGGPGGASEPPQQHRDAEALYRYMFYRMGREPQRLGMLCLAGGDDQGLLPSLDFLTQPGDRHTNAPPSIELAKLSRFRALGQVMGLALRTGVALPLRLSDDVWRLFVELEQETSRKEGTDSEADDPLASVCRVLSTDGILASMPEQGLRMVAPLSTGRVVPLDRGAPVVPCNPENATTFVRRALALAVAEGLPAASAIYAGLTSVVPMHTLPFLTPAELRKLVCGDGKAYVRLVKDCVTYRDGCGERHRAVQV